VQAGRARVDGDAGALRTWVGLMDKFDSNFAIVTP